MLAYLANPTDEPHLAVQDAVATSGPDVVLFLDLQDFSRSANGSPRSTVAHTVEWIELAHSGPDGRARELTDQEWIERWSLIVPCIAVLDLPSPGLAPPETVPIARAGGILVKRPKGYDRLEAQQQKVRVLDDWVGHLEQDGHFNRERHQRPEEPSAWPLRGQDPLEPDEATLDVYYNPAFGLPREDFERLVDMTRSRDDIPPTHHGKRR